MMKVEQLENAIDQLESILVAVVALTPAENEVERLNRIYKAVENARNKLLDFAGFEICNLE